MSPRIFDMPETVRCELVKRLVNSGFSHIDSHVAWAKERGFQTSRSAVGRLSTQIQAALKQRETGKEPKRPIPANIWVLIHQAGI